jgi:hypothetical protein
MAGSNVFAALMLARALAGPDREPVPVPEPEFRPMFPRDPSARIRAPEPDAEREAAQAPAQIPSGKAAWVPTPR